MSWVCSNCSTPNDDTNTSCFVCEETRHAVVVEDAESDCKVVFSGFEAWVESIGEFLKKILTKKERIGESVAPRKRKTKEPKPKKVKKVKAPKNNFAKPWDEHKVKFDIDVIKGKGYVRSEQHILNGIKGYMFYKDGEKGRFIRIEMILVQKMAHKV